MCLPVGPSSKRTLWGPEGWNMEHQPQRRNSRVRGEPEHNPPYQASCNCFAIMAFATIKVVMSTAIEVEVPFSILPAFVNALSSHGQLNTDSMQSRCTCTCSASGISRWKSMCRAFQLTRSTFIRFELPCCVFNDDQ